MLQNATVYENFISPIQWNIEMCMNFYVLILLLMLWLYFNAISFFNSTNESIDQSINPAILVGIITVALMSYQFRPAGGARREI